MKSTFLKTKKHAAAFGWSFLLCGGLLMAILMLPKDMRAQPRSAGEAVKVLSPSQGVFTHALWAPDGKTLAFSSDNFNGIWLANADGSKLRQLTQDMGVGFGFSWSPCGRFILARAAVMENNVRFHQIKLYDLKSLQAEIVLNNTRELSGLPYFTSDGTHIAYVLGKQPQFAEPASLNKSNGKAGLTETVLPVADKLISLHPQNRIQKQLADFEQRFVFNVRHSPDGKKIVFQVQGKGLYVMNTDGTSLKHIGNGEYASWLPGSDYVVVSVVEDNGRQITHAVLYAVDIKSGSYFPLTSHLSLVALKPAVSPCGKWLAFEDATSGAIYVMPLN